MTWAPPTMYAPPQHRWGAAAIVATVGSGLLIIGSFLPWATIQLGYLNASVNGIDGDGKITAIVGLVAGTLLAVGASTSQRALLLIGAIVAALGAAAAGYDLVNLSRIAADLDNEYIDANPGVGLFVCLAGGLGGFIAGMIAQSDAG